VIGASRLSYLYAIDPLWTARTLIPSFNWQGEEESNAAWQGFAWQARIDPQLWVALKEHFVLSFRTERLERLGRWGSNIAQALMLIGVEFGVEELKRDTARDAIRAMPDRLRRDAAAWIRIYMKAGKGDDNQSVEGSPDERWTQRVWPWLKRVWPMEKALRSSSVTEQFVLGAIATEGAFPTAVKDIHAFAIKISGSHWIHDLHVSQHPTIHPEATLDLLETFLAPDRLHFFQKNLTEIIQQIGTASANLRQDNRYRRWVEILRQL
jgi:hypothetical protein